MPERQHSNDARPGWEVPRRLLERIHFDAQRPGKGGDRGFA